MFPNSIRLSMIPPSRPWCLFCLINNIFTTTLCRISNYINMSVRGYCQKITSLVMLLIIMDLVLLDKNSQIRRLSKIYGITSPCISGRVGYFNLPDASTSGFHCSCGHKMSVICRRGIITATANFSKHFFFHLSHFWCCTAMVKYATVLHNIYREYDLVSPVIIIFWEYILVSKTSFVGISFRWFTDYTNGKYRPELALKPWHTRCCCCCCCYTPLMCISDWHSSENCQQLIRHADKPTWDNKFCKIIIR